MKTVQELLEETRKFRISQAAAAVEFNKKHPEPMGIFRKREKLMNELSAIYRKPEVPKGVAERAGQAMAAWDNSDPFSYGRTVLHVRQGYLRADEVVKETTMRTIARKAAKAKEVDDAKS